MILQQLLWFSLCKFYSNALEGSIVSSGLQYKGYWVRLCTWMSWMPLITSYSTFSHIILNNHLTSVKPHVAHSACPLGLTRHLLSTTPMSTTHSSQPKMKQHTHTHTVFYQLVLIFFIELSCLSPSPLSAQNTVHLQQLQHQLLTFTTTMGGNNWTILPLGR